jgi:N-acyl homoserine lactone hydrolase
MDMADVRPRVHFWAMTLRSILPLGALLGIGCAAHLPPIQPHAFVPPAVPLEQNLEVCWLETAGTQGWGGFGSAGSSTTETWHATASAILVRHPSGDVLIDTGNPTRLDDEVTELSLWGRFLTQNLLFGRFERRGDLLQMLAAAGSDPKKLKAIVLSHAHGDHAGAVSDLPGVPVLLPAEELAFITEGLAGGKWWIIPAHARAIAQQGVALSFDAGPYANFESSADVFGDGTVVIVPLFGHTPGSVGIFVNLSATQRLLHVGDTVNTVESVDREARKFWLMRALTDSDGELAASQIARLAELRRADPALQLLPAHDRAAWATFFGEPPAGQSLTCVRPSSERIAARKP